MPLSFFASKFLRAVRSYASRMLVVVVGLVVLEIATRVGFRLDGLLAPLKEGLSRGVVPYLAFGIGLILQVRFFQPPLRSARKSRLRREAQFVVLFFVMLSAFYYSFVYHKDQWSKAYVLSWARSEKCAVLADADEGAAESDPVEMVQLCDGLEDYKCIDVLLGLQNRGYEPEEMVDLCWGKRGVRFVEFSLAGLYCLFAGSLGSVTGLLVRPRSMTRVFVSYRSRNAPLVRGPIARALVDRYGMANVFTDKLSIEAGEDWEQKIRVTAKKYDVFVVVIEPDWMGLLQERAKGDERDWVFYEVETAIARDVGLVPLMFGGAKALRSEEFEGELKRLKPLARLEAVVLDRGVIAIEEDFKIIKEEVFKERMAEVILAVDRAADRQVA